MKRNLILTLSLMTVLIVSGAAVPQQSVADLFQQAVHQEEVKGDLQAAIPLYQKVERESSDRSLAARAQLRIGLCYEKLGKDEARKAYERLVRNYADQPDQVKLARVRLAALGKAADASKEPAFANRKVWTDYRITPMIGVSPDGRYLSFVDYYSGDLAIRDLETGTNRRLTNKGSWESMEYAVRSRWSPDSKQIAYEWADDTKGCQELRIIAREGGKPRTLIDCEEKGYDKQWMNTHDWSPDGKQILILLWKGGPGQIVLVSAVDGTMRVLKTFQENEPEPHAMYFSRDGRYIAYDPFQEENSNRRDISLISVDRGNEVSLVKHPAHDFLLGWSPDREGILFSSDRRTGSLDLWFLAVSAGKVQGVPESVQRLANKIEPIGFTQSGSFYYTQMTELNVIDVYVVRMDPQSGKILAPPETVAMRFGGYNYWPAYSPDGKYLAYVTGRNRALFSDRSERPNVLCIRSLETGKEQEFSTSFYNVGNPQWSPDGQFIYFGALIDQVGGGLYRINTQNGRITPISETPQGHPPGVTLVDWQFTPDGKSMIWEGQFDPNEAFQILIRDDPWIQEDKQIYTGNLTMFSISPDGRWLALKFNEGTQKVVQVMPASGGQPKELLRYEEETDYIGRIEWTADGKYILFQKVIFINDKRHFSLWRIAAEGGEPQELNLMMASINGLSAHPDGQQLAFTSVGFTRNLPSVWVMENFLPPAAGGGK